MPRSTRAIGSAQLDEALLGRVKQLSSFHTEFLDANWGRTRHESLYPCIATDELQPPPLCDPYVPECIVHSSQFGRESIGRRR